MAPPLEIRTVYDLFSRHGRNYCLFSLAGRDEDFLYYSHVSRPLRSLMSGRNFCDRIPSLLNDETLCIECGLGLAVAGGVALDDGDLIAWNCTVDEANRILAALKDRLGDAGHWIEPF